MKIQAQYEDTIENLTFFAIKKGWQPKVIENIEVTKTSEDGLEYIETESIEIDNPTTLNMFLTQYARQLLLVNISEPILQEVEERSRASIESAKEQYLSKLNDNLIVDVI